MTGPVLEVDIDALNADGRRLESLGDPLTPSNCAPPGSDAVSLGAVRALNAHESALIEILSHATLVRQYGGAVVRSAAVAFERADRAGAESIRRVDDTDAPPIAPSSGPLQMPTLPPLPRQPSIATVPELPSLPSIGGEQFSVDLHSGPGSSDLRDFSRTWHNYGEDIIRTADDTAAVFVSVSEHWSSGDKAANNISSHATWLDSAARWAERLSVAAEAVAHAFEIAMQNTPTPEQFAGAASVMMKAALEAEADEAAKQYHAAVSDALTAIGDPIAPCPPIASRGDIPEIPLPPVQEGEVPPDVIYNAAQLENAPRGPDIVIGRRPKQTVLMNGLTYVGGEPYRNDDLALPTMDAAQSPITYQEYDRYPYAPGVGRGSDRIILGSDGSRYFTSDHYETFVSF